VADVIITTIGLLTGALFLSFLDKITPHTHFIKGEEGPSSRLKNLAVHLCYYITQPTRRFGCWSWLWFL